jgi:hypothetical protein
MLPKQFMYPHNIVCIEEQSSLKMSNLNNIPIK